MGKAPSAWAVGVLLSASCLVGCDQEVKLTFVNLTGDDLDVHLTSPAGGRQYLGVISPVGRLCHDLAIDKDDLPVTCIWSAGAYRGRFPVSKDSQKELRIEIGPVGGPPAPIESPGVDGGFETPAEPGGSGM